MSPDSTPPPGPLAQDLATKDYISPRGALIVSIPIDLGRFCPVGAAQQKDTEVTETVSFNPTPVTSQS